MTGRPNRADFQQLASKQSIEKEKQLTLSFLNELLELCLVSSTDEAQRRIVDVEDGVHIGNPLRDGLDVRELASHSLLGSTDLPKVKIGAAEARKSRSRIVSFSNSTGRDDDGRVRTRGARRERNKIRTHCFASAFPPRMETVKVSFQLVISRTWALSELGL